MLSFYTETLSNTWYPHSPIIVEAPNSYGEAELCVVFFLGFDTYYIIIYTITHYYACTIQLN